MKHHRRRRRRGQGGHGTHTGPIWNPAIAKPWGDIIPAFDYYNDQGDAQHYPGSTHPAGNAILADDCTTQIAIPAKPVPTPPTCSADGSLTLVNGDALHLDRQQALGLRRHAHRDCDGRRGLRVHERQDDRDLQRRGRGCHERLQGRRSSRRPSTQPTCTGPGTSSPGSITPGTSAHVTYSLNGTVVTATTQAPYTFSADERLGHRGNGLTATYTVTLVPAGDCLTEVIPVAPNVDAVDVHRSWDAQRPGHHAGRHRRDHLLA